MDEEYLTVPEVAQKLKVTRAAVYQWMQSGKLKYVVVGSTRRVTSSALMDFITQSTEAEQSQKNGKPRLDQVILA